MITQEVGFFILLPLAMVMTKSIFLAIDLASCMTCIAAVLLLDVNNQTKLELYFPTMPTELLMYDDIQYLSLQ